MDNSGVSRKLGSARHVIRLLFGASLLTAVSGCTSPLYGTGGPTVWGRVTYHGKPVTDAIIMYSPETSESTPKDTDTMEATALLGTDGNYRIRVNDRGLPLPVGWCRITLRPISAPIPDSVESNQKGEPPAGRPGEALPGASDNKAAKAPAAADTHPFPKSYQETNTTKLKIWLRAQPMKVDIDLQD